MHLRRRVPIALTIAGSDSGGGAGIQADLKTFMALGVHGTSAVTCLTAQNPQRVAAVHPVPVEFLRAQLECVLEGLEPSAVKTGMLFSRPLIDAVASFWKSLPGIPLVVDPVMISTSGAQLLDPKAMRSLCDNLLPLARVVTPNVDEAGILVGRKLRTLEDLREASRQIYRQFGCAALLKGGHLGSSLATDILFDGEKEVMLSAPFVRGVATHGTGCTYSAAITAGLALGCDLEKSVRLGKKFITQAIRKSVRIGANTALNPGLKEK
jgi:hydroxymethylpyrimidine/phosphomethylpyrimidine kinase